MNRANVKGFLKEIAYLPVVWMVFVVLNYWLLSDSVEVYGATMYYDDLFLSLLGFCNIIIGHKYPELC